MDFAGLNPIAIAVAGFGGLAFSALYFALLCGSRTAALDRATDEPRRTGARAALPFIVAIVALLVMAWVLAGVLGHLGPGQVTVRNGLISALFLWVGFVATTIAVNNVFARRKLALTFIDAGHWLGVLLVQGSIIGAFGV